MYDQRSRNEWLTLVTEVQTHANVDRTAGTTHRKVRSTGIRLGADEVLVIDLRARMTPDQFVEEKLAGSHTFLRFSSMHGPFSAAYFMDRTPKSLTLDSIPYPIYT